MNKTLGAMLRTMVNKNARDWDLHLARAEFSYNNAPSSATKYAPFEVVYGTKPLDPLDMIEVPRHMVIPKDVESHTQQLKEIHEFVRLNIEKANEVYKKRADKGVKERRNFQPGDLVWVHLRKDRFPKQRKNKLFPRADGPFEVLEKVGENAYKIDLRGEYGVASTFNIGDLQPYHGDLDLRANPFEEGENATSANELQGDELGFQGVQRELEHTQGLKLIYKSLRAVQGGDKGLLIEDQAQEEELEAQGLRAGFVEERKGLLGTQAQKKQQGYPLSLLAVQGGKEDKFYLHGPSDKDLLCLHFVGIQL